MEPIIGQIVMFAGNFAPLGWALCNGAEMSINQNQALFSILGTTYGGNGTTNFKLPNLSGVVNTGTEDPQPVVNYLIATVGIYPSRN